MTGPDLSRAAWRKSSYSGQNGNCVEIAVVPGSGQGSDRVIAVRDSKNPRGSALFFTPAQWRAFAAGVKAGGFDLS
jgi:hypothetical protein